MTDYISREMTIDAICRLCNANFEEDPCEPSECEMMSLLRKIPAADVRPRWIPVTERLPEQYVNVLVFLHSLDWNSIYYSIDHLMEDGQWWKASTSWKHEVTHWMPLPSAPAEE